MKYGHSFNASTFGKSKQDYKKKTHFDKLIFNSKNLQNDLAYLICESADISIYNLMANIKTLKQALGITNQTLYTKTNHISKKLSMSNLNEQGKSKN